MKYESPFKYPDEHMRLLGIIAAHWESLELILDMTLAAVMSHQHGRVALFTSNMAFAAKMDLITIFARDAFVINGNEPDRWTEYNKIANRLRSAYAGRNRYIHARWLVDEESGALTRQDIRTRGGKLDVTEKPATTDEMVEAAKEIIAAGEAVIDFFYDVGIELRPQESS